MSSHLGRAAITLALLVLALSPAAGSEAGRSDSWLDDVAVLVTEEESAAYLALTRDYQRRAFREAFWRQRDPFPETGGNEFRETFEARLQLARDQLESLEGDRARAFLLIGPPERVLANPCAGELPFSEFWLYPSRERRKGGFHLLFVRGAATPDGYRLWSPREGLRSLIRWPSGGISDEELLAELVDRCLRGREAVAAILATVDWETVAKSRPLVPEPSPEWVATFLSRSTELPSGVETFDARFSVGYPGRQQSRTVVQAVIEVASEEIEALTPGRTPFYRLQLDGEVLRKDELFERFRYRYDFPADDLATGRMPIAVERLLRPGTYRLALKLRDLGSDRFFRVEHKIVVPREPDVVAAAPAREAPTPAAESPASRTAAEARPVLSGPFREANLTARPIESHLRLLPMADGVLIGHQRLHAIASHPAIHKVSFLLNGRTVMTKRGPPFSVEIDLGDAPRVHTIEAVAFDAEGQEMARDLAPLNSGAQRFAVKLVEPRPGQRFEESLHARAAVDVPRGSTLAKVEFYLDDMPLATVFQPPYALPVRIPDTNGMAYLRAVAHLADGNFTEDLVFINAPEQLDHLRVDFVELYTSVVNKTGRPVQGLERDVFQVFEEGVEQEVRRFERVDDLPIHAAILLDTSTSMEEELREAERAALKFFERVIEPMDRASVIVFADAPELRVPLTSNLEVLAGGLSGIVADGETALYDSVIFGLYQLAGIRGKKALVLLSDGADSRSRHSQREMLDYAARSGVAVYTIGLDIDAHDVEARSAMQRLARETGGETFWVDRATALDRVYQQIEEDLRSQYLLGYQSTGVPGSEFREVEVKVAVSGLRAKTVPGYYP